MSEQKPGIAEKLSALQHTFEARLPERLGTIRNAWETAQQQGADAPAALKELYRLVHSMAGSAGTFGYHRLGKAARQLEELVMQINGGADDAGDVQSVNSALALLAAFAIEGQDNNLEAAVINTAVATPAATANVNKRIYLLEDDTLLAAEIVNQLEHFGYEVKPFHGSAEIVQAQTTHPADLLLLDIALPEGPLEGIAMAPQLQALSETPLPVVFISARDDWQARLAALRAGGRAYFKKPLDFPALVEQLDKLLILDRTENIRVLIVEDDVLLAEHYAAVLHGAGMQVTVINDPVWLLDVMVEFTPELLLVDLYMPHISGIEVAQIIRQHPSYQSLPIVYLSTERGLHQQLEALKMGGDDFLQKPISDEHLIAAVTIRAQRFRGLNTLMRCDGLTGLLNHISLKLTLERELLLIQRQRGALTFVMIDIDHFKTVNDRYGHPVGDQVIKSLTRLLTLRLRKSDTAARYGGEEFALILPDTPLAAAHALIDNLRQSFAQIVFSHGGADFSVTFSAGIAAASPCGGMNTLIEAADQALYEAKQRGRDQVVISPPGT